MAGYSYAFVHGRITQDLVPKIIKGKDGKPDRSVLSFSVAVNKSKKYPATFIRCEAWGFGAEWIAKWFRKGSLITVIGEFKNSQFYDNNGNRREQIVVMVIRAMFGDVFEGNVSEKPRVTQAAPEQDTFDTDGWEDIPY